MKRYLRKGGPLDLNIYTLGFPEGRGLLGYSNLPIDYRKFPELDGVVINVEGLPGSKGNFNLGATAAHEVGHWYGH